MGKVGIISVVMIERYDGQGVCRTKGLKRSGRIDGEEGRFY